MGLHFIFKSKDNKNFSLYASTSEIYPTLWSLEKRNVITSRIENIGRKNRVVYRPIPFITRNYLEAKRNVENRNRAKINKIGGEALSFQFVEPAAVEIKEE